MLLNIVVYGFDSREYHNHNINDTRYNQISAEMSYSAEFFFFKLLLLRKPHPVYFWHLAVYLLGYISNVNTAFLLHNGEH